MKVDPETKKIALSLRRAQPQQWDDIVERYQVGEVVPGIVTKLVTFGAFARIEGPVEGLIHVSELVDKRIAHPREAVREGDILPLRIVRIEKDRHRLGLSLKQARERGEVMGFEFGADGDVMFIPSELRERFHDELAALDLPDRSEENGGRASAPVAARAAVDDLANAAPSAPSREEPEEVMQGSMAAALAGFMSDAEEDSDTIQQEENV